MADARGSHLAPESRTRWVRWVVEGMKDSISNCQTDRSIFPTSFQMRLLILVVAAIAATSGEEIGRVKRQLDFEENEIQGSAIDFSQAEFDPETGKQCVIKETEVESIEKEPILECNHREVEKCHYTYVTQFNPAQEEVCEESFEKTCQITFKQQALQEKSKKCYRPLIKVCNGQGKEECRTVYESSCTTRYIEKRPGKFVGDTRCEKVPIEVCGAGCVTEEGPEECHDKANTVLVDVPEEICELNPQKACRLQTKLVPSLVPKHECTIVPQEVCNLKFTAPKLVKKPLMSKWCLDDSEPTRIGETYEESDARGNPIQTAQASRPVPDSRRPRPRPNDRRRQRPDSDNSGLRRSGTAPRRQQQQQGNRRRQQQQRRRQQPESQRRNGQRRRQQEQEPSLDLGSDNISYDDTFSPGFGGGGGGGGLNLPGFGGRPRDVRWIDEHGEEEAKFCL